MSTPESSHESHESEFVSPVDKVAPKTDETANLNYPDLEELSRQRRESATRARQRIRELHITNRRTGSTDSEYHHLETESVSKIQAQDRYERHAFGSGALRDVDWALERDDRREVAISEASLTLGASRDKLVDLLQNSPNLANEPLPELERYYLDGNNQPVSEIIASLTIEQYEAFLRARGDRLKAEAEIKRQSFDRLKDAFQQRVLEAIQRQQIPLTPQQLAQRLEQVQIRCFDRWENPNALGSYEPWSKTFYLPVTATDQEIRETIDHEGFHALEGVTGQVTNKVRDGNSIVAADTVRTGLTIQPRFGETRFKWLNEAVTEDMNMEVNELSEGVYELEREILYLLERRIHAIDIRRAYFEDFEENTDQEQRLPAWKSLQRRLNAAFEPGILVTLDKLIKSAPDEDEGLEQAIAYLNRL
jgi:hypothetical protein